MSNNTNHDQQSQQSAPIKPSYLVISPQILYNKDLSDSEKITLSFLTMFMHDKGYCWWSNGRLCQLLNIDKRQLQRRLNKLESLGFIRIDHNNGNQRIIYANDPDKVIHSSEIEPTDKDDTHVTNDTPPHVINDTQKYISNKTIKIKKENKKRKKEKVTENEQEIFDYWAKRTDRFKTKLTSKRLTKIRNGLKSGYSVDDLKQAIDGCMSSDYHQGANDQNKIYDELELILRNEDCIERFMSYKRKAKVRDPNAQATIEERRDKLDATESGMLDTIIDTCETIEDAKPKLYDLGVQHHKDFAFLLSEFKKRVEKKQVNQQTRLQHMPESQNKPVVEDFRPPDDVRQLYQREAVKRPKNALNNIRNISSLLTGLPMK